jgi:hypothetical protein
MTLWPVAELDAGDVYRRPALGDSSSLTPTRIRLGPPSPTGSRCEEVDLGYAAQSG